MGSHWTRCPTLLHFRLDLYLDVCVTVVSADSPSSPPTQVHTYSHESCPMEIMGKFQLASWAAPAELNGRGGSFLASLYQQLFSKRSAFYSSLLPVLVEPLSGLITYYHSCEEEGNTPPWSSHCLQAYYSYHGLILVCIKLSRWKHKVAMSTFISQWEDISQRGQVPVSEPVTHKTHTYKTQTYRRNQRVKKGGGSLLVI